MTSLPKTHVELSLLSDLDILQLAKTVLEHDSKLLQHGFRMETPDGFCHCVVGAVREACGAYAIGMMNQDHSWDRVNRIVANVFAPLIDLDELITTYKARTNWLNEDIINNWRRGVDLNSNVYSYNDFVLYDQLAPDRGKAKAIAFIDQAIEKLQAEGATA